MSGVVCCLYPFPFFALRFLVWFYAPYVQQAGGSFFSSVDRFNSFLVSVQTFHRRKDLQMWTSRGSVCTTEMVPSVEHVTQCCGQTASME